MTEVFRRFLADTSAATAIEYGLIGAILTAAIVAGFGQVTGAFTDIMTLAGTHLSDASK